MSSRARAVVGIDVGGVKKGFHAVALRGQCVIGLFASRDPHEIAAWCLKVGAQVIGVDAPCRWSDPGNDHGGRSRLAERALAKVGISCFSSPTHARAVAHSDNKGIFYGWMFNGEALFAELEKTHRLFDGSSATRRGGRFKSVCFETFPQAVACALAGEIVPAKKKRTVRSQLLQKAGIDITLLTNIDLIDAALCAVTANAFLDDKIKAYGDAAEGVIVVPG